MVSTHEIIKYMIAHQNGDGIIRTPFDDPIMLQAELDGYAIREAGRWRAFGIIQPGEQRTLRYLDGSEPEIIIGTEEMRTKLEREAQTWA